MIERLPPVELDLEGHLDNLYRRNRPKRVFFFEHGEETGVKEQLCGRFALCDGLDRSHQDFMRQREIRINQFLGQELMRVFPGGIVWPGLPTDTTAAPPTVGPIQSWDDLEEYAWPRLADVDFSDVEWFEKNLPDNIGMWAMTYLFQQVSNLLGFETLCMMLHLDRGLVQAVIDKVATFFIEYTDVLCQFSRVAAINVGDDMGHKTGTLISPDDIRELFLPWHKRIIGKAHEYGKLAIFHICGQVDVIMDDLIDSVGIDAKHSTQDLIEPMARTKEKWGHRVALLGGIDVDVITRATTREVRTYTRGILEVCAPSGGFSLGVGNWVADSMPIDNYLAMIDEARRFAL